MPFNASGRIIGRWALFSFLTGLSDWAKRSLVKASHGLDYLFEKFHPRKMIFFDWLSTIGNTLHFHC